MFDSLDDRMKQDDRVNVTATERWVRWLIVAVCSVVLFGGLYMGIRALE